MHFLYGDSKSKHVVFLVGSSFPNFVLRRVYVVSDNHIFVEQQSAGNGHGYWAYGELSQFVYCIFQKIKKSESMPLVEKCEKYMLSNHSAFADFEG